MSARRGVAGAALFGALTLVASRADAQRAFDCKSDVARTSALRAFAKAKGQPDPYTPSALESSWWPVPVDMMRRPSTGPDRFTAKGRIKVNGSNVVFWTNSASGRSTRVLVRPIASETASPPRKLGVTLCGYNDSAKAKVGSDLSLVDSASSTMTNGRSTDLWTLDGKTFRSVSYANYAVILSPSWYSGEVEYEITVNASGT